VTCDLFLEDPWTSTSWIEQSVLPWGWKAPEWT